MSFIKTMKQKWYTLTHTPRLFGKKFASTKLFKILPDKIALKIMYRNCFLEKLDLKNPQTFNAKLQWLKLYNRKPEYTIMVDKYRVREYIKDTIGEEYLIPLLGVWEKAEDIDFDLLPDKFVLKCNHGSACNIICKDKSKLNREETVKQLNKWMETNYYKISREWPYKNVPRRIIAEQYMEDTKNEQIYDYKFFCFGGMAKCVKVDFDRFVVHHANYYDLEGNLMNIGEGVAPPDFERDIGLPENYTMMQQLAEKLSKDIPFLRADFYDVEGKIYFGEMTFFPASGLGEFISYENDVMLGKWLKLPLKNGGGLILVDNLIIVFQKKHRGLNDYKMLCFDGKVRLLEIHRDRYGEKHTQDYYNENLELTDFQNIGEQNSYCPIEEKEPIYKMIRLSEKLACDIPHVRVDWYYSENKIYFGELTFFDAGGFAPFCGKQDKTIGEMLDLNKIQNYNK